MTKKAKTGTISTSRVADKKELLFEKETQVFKKMLVLLGAGKLRIHPHANERMGQRNVIYFEILQALSNGRHIESRDRFSEVHKSWQYCMEGYTMDLKFLRLGVAFEKVQKTNERLLVITVIDITKKKG